MAGDAAGDDDLDAFFDEVEEVAANAEEPADKVVAEPPLKKARPTVKGVVVAAASEKIRPKEPDTTTSSTKDTSAAAAQPYAGPVAPPLAPGMPYPPPHAARAAAGGATLPIGPLPHMVPPVASSAQQQDGTNVHGTAKASSASHVRTAAGKTWVDPTLDEWPSNDFRIFVGNLGSDVTDDNVWQHFSKYTSLLKAKIIRDMNKPGQPSRGYAFVSFGDALECAKALREMDQTWIGSRPIRIKRSNWKDRELKNVRNEQKKRKKQHKRMGLL